MYLKNYQIKVVSALRNFIQAAAQAKTEDEKIKKELSPELYKKASFNWVKTTFENIRKTFYDDAINGLGEPYPRICIKIPTGGGKTVLAVEAIREFQNIFLKRSTGLVVWIVPTETIYSQTVNKLRDKSNFLRQLLDQASGGKTIILEKGQRLTEQDIKDNLVVLFVMIQSVSRKNGKESLKVFQDSGGYESFFPLDNRYDLHKQMIQQIPNLDVISDVNTAFPQIKTSLGNAIRITNPLIIIDEIHKVFSEQARETINKLNPSMVLGLSATPKHEMNILVTITGLELKEEEMVKLDMHIIEPQGRRNDDWRGMIKEIKGLRNKLEKKSDAYHRNNGIYIRPIALIQVEATGRDQRGLGRVHSQDVKEYLISIGVNADEIAIKTSAQNDIEDVDLFSKDCVIRFIITKEALKEGWDCSFAYILGIIPNVNSTTSITQLVGRILRQPYARKTKIKELDESYVFYSKGSVQGILKQVDAGFRHEGLETLLTDIKIKSITGVNAEKIVKIKQEYRKKFANSFYLPVWLMIEENNKKRKFKYEIDIKPRFNFDKIKLTEKFINELNKSLSSENRDRLSYGVTLNDESKFKAVRERTQLGNIHEININYITRRFTEVVENAFIARELANRFTVILKSTIGEEKLGLYFGYITTQLTEMLLKYKEEQEEDIFDKLKNQNKLILAISKNEVLGYCIPEKDTIKENTYNKLYKYYLYEEADYTSMNKLEKDIGQILDKQDKILWWYKNKIRKDWYSVKGWRKGNIYPDFVAAKKNKSGGLDLVYVIESKGEHLLGNADTLYKDSVFKKMNKAKLKLMSLDLFDNKEEKVEYYLIEEGEEEKKVKELYK